MRSILKKIAVRKNDKENIGPIYGSGRRSHKLSIGSLPWLLVNSANIIYGCLHTHIETTFCRLSALCNWVTKETLLFNGRSHTRREVRLSIVWACIVWSNWRMLARRRHLLAGVHRCRTIDWLINWLIDWLINWFIDSLIDWLIDWLFDSNKGLMWRPGAAIAPGHHNMKPRARVHVCGRAIVSWSQLRL